MSGTNKGDRYRFRWRCDACHEFGDWYDNPDDAKAARDDHESGHDELLIGPTRIQRYPADEVLSR